MDDTRTEPTLHALPTAPRPRSASPAFPDDADELIDQTPQPRSHRRRRRIRWVIGLLLVCAAIALWSILWQPQTVSHLPIAVPPKAPVAAQPSNPRYPIDAPRETLPPLDASDAAILAALQALWSGSGLATYLEPRDLVRNVVATVDNLHRRALPSQRSPLKPAGGSFGTASSGGGLVIGESNALRYTPYVRLLERVEPQALVHFYVRYYPLFQQAYRDLGYPNGHFNDRLVESIDLLLATPEPQAALKVVQPRIFYEFADRDFEQLPAGQKLMLRMGAENAAAVKQRLRAIRAMVTAPLPPVDQTLAESPSVPTPFDEEGPGGNAAPKSARR